MALIKRVVTEEKIILLKYHLFGRLEEKCETILYGNECSRIHAVIEYKAREWVLTDMSSNGTLLNNILLLGKSVVLKSGDVIKYSLDSANDFVVMDADEPSSFIIDESKKKHHILLNNVLELQEDGKGVLFYQTRDYQWNIEKDGKTIPLADGDVFDYDGGKWTFVQYIDYDLTYREQLKPADFEFYFEISPDYEHVFIQIKVANKIIELPIKAMNYTLYLLAKRCKKDLELNSLTENEYGWVDNDELISELAKELGNDKIDVYYLNVQVFRLRKAFSKTSYGLLLNGLIERRSGQIRFKHHNIKIKEYSSEEA